MHLKALLSDWLLPIHFSPRLNIGDCVLVSLTNINSKQKLPWYSDKLRLTHRWRGEETERQRGKEAKRQRVGVFAVSCRVVSERCSFAAASLACSPARHPLIIHPKAPLPPPQIENDAEQRQNAARRVTHELLNYLPCTSVVAKTVDLRILSCSFHALHANPSTSVCRQNWSEGHI